MSASWESASEGGGHGTITVVCLIPCVHLCLIAWYHYQIQVCLRVHIWKWWKGKWNIRSHRLFCGILHLAAEQCWASVLKLWIIYKQKYLQRSVYAHVGVTARRHCWWRSGGVIVSVHVRLVGEIKVKSSRCGSFGFQRDCMSVFSVQHAYTWLYASGMIYITAWAWVTMGLRVCILACVCIRVSLTVCIPARSSVVCVVPCSAPC